jgi:hypothetical protein
VVIDAKIPFLVESFKTLPMKAAEYAGKTGEE